MNNEQQLIHPIEHWEVVKKTKCDVIVRRRSYMLHAERRATHGAGSRCAHKATVALCVNVSLCVC